MNCGSCRHYEAPAIPGEIRGLCLRFPPVLLELATKKEAPKFGYPRTAAGDRCGEYASAAEARVIRVHAAENPKADAEPQLIRYRAEGNQ